MAIKLTSADPALSRLVEKQMRNWELARSQRISTPTPKQAEVEDFLCISRMVGVDDRQVAVLVGERLGWPVFDREILEAMAGDDDFRRQIYTSMDQRDLSWWEEALRSLMDRDFVRNDYFHRLCETLLSLARQGNSVFLGRGADLVLPRSRGFRVRLVAPLATRAERYAELTGLAPKQARNEIARIEKDRAEFLQRHFGIGIDDPLRYDITINLERFSHQQAVDLILQAREMLGGAARG
jgi:cytidylate kinase